MKNYVTLSALIAVLALATGQLAFAGNEGRDANRRSSLYS